MAMRVRKIENLVSHYSSILQQSSASRKVVESWGVQVKAELRHCREVEDYLVGLLSEHVERIG